MGKTDRSAVVQGGLVFDGTGSAGRHLDIRIEDGVITDLDPIVSPAPTDRVVVAAGHWIVPGFIDVHSHDDLAVLTPHGVDPKLAQGVTTVVTGNCGHGPAPSHPTINDYSLPVLGPFPSTQWASFSDYLDQVAASALRTNVVPLVPHTPLRAAVLGFREVVADGPERARIAHLVSEAVTAGAVGLSLGLMYAPGNHADTAELISIGRVLQASQALLVAHLRNEAGQLMKSLEEFADIGRHTGVALHISHLKVTGPNNFGTMPAVVDKLDGLRAEGIDITADLYPYTAGSTTVATLFPSWATGDGVAGLIRAASGRATRQRLVTDLTRPWPLGDLENYYHSVGPQNILLAGFRTPELVQFEGQSISAIARTLTLDPAEALIEMVLAESGRLTIVLFQTDPEGISHALSWPFTMIGTDGLPAPTGYVHPRLYGTFPRLITEFAGPSKAIGTEEAIRRGTHLAAQRFSVPHRGLLAPGQIADLQIIDPDRYRDRASFANPRQSPDGIDGVWVDGSTLDPTVPSLFRGQLLRRTPTTRVGTPS